MRALGETIRFTVFPSQSKGNTPEMLKLSNYVGKKKLYGSPKSGKVPALPNGLCCDEHRDRFRRHRAGTSRRHGGSSRPAEASTYM